MEGRGRDREEVGGVWHPIWAQREAGMGADCPHSCPGSGTWTHSETDSDADSGNERSDLIGGSPEETSAHPGHQGELPGGGDG